MNSHFDADVIEQFSQIESQSSIDKNERGHRPGPASGVTLFEDRDKCKSFSKVTQKDTSLLLASSETGTNMSIHYFNKDDIIKRSSFGYKSLLMKRIRARDKWRQACSCSSFRHILVKEATSYLIAIACLKSIGIPPPREQINRISTLNAIIERNAKETILNCLIMWMCTSGEMRNHEAVACHVDGNNRHTYEIYSLFHRFGMERKDGFLYLPLHNVVLRIECDNHIMVCNFKSTPHVADESRNTNNFSKVHGPDP